MRKANANVTSGTVHTNYISGKANCYNVTCKVCGNIIEKGKGIRFAGYNGGFIHESCAPSVESYHRTNNFTPNEVGKTTKAGWQTSWEMETVWLTTNRETRRRILREMVAFGYKPEDDCSLHNHCGYGTEFKGLISHKNNGLSQHAMFLTSECMKNGSITTEDPCCGTHLNLSNSWVRDFQWSRYGSENFLKIAQASIDVLAEDNRLTAICFGRACTHYANPTAGYHGSAINTDHLTEAKKADTRFEFRICKFHSGIAQGGNRYFDAIDIWKGWITTLQTAIEKGWAVDRIATKCATYLRKRMEKMALEVDNEWIEWVTR